MTRKLEAVQTAVKSYFERFPRVSIKALSMRTGVPYATLRRILQHEVNDIKDETIFKLIDRVMLRPERMGFLREHYPALAKVMSDETESPGDEETNSDQLKRFRYLDPHNYILQLAGTGQGIHRDDIQRLTGERGLFALEEMLESGVLLEDRELVRAASVQLGRLDIEDTLYQISKDLQYFPRSLAAGPYTRLSHASQGLSREGLQKLVGLSQRFWQDLQEIRDQERGDIACFINLAIAPYDRQALVRPVSWPQAEPVQSAEASLVAGGLIQSSHGDLDPECIP